MSAEFRQRTPGEYLQLAWKRRWLIILPAVAIFTAVAWVVWRLPNVYESTTLLIVKPPTISPNIVPTLSDYDLGLRINNISQRVQSRSVLEPLILKYDLYQAERRNGEPMELTVERMRKDITTEVDKGRNDITNAFKISYRERDPRRTQLVTAELATKYVDAQMQGTTLESQKTQEFFQQQLAEAKKQLDEIDRQRIQFMTSNEQSLPSVTQPMVGQLTRLGEQQKALISEIGRLRDSYNLQSNQLNDLTEQSKRDNDEIAEQIGNVKTTPAYGQLITRKAALEGEVQNMRAALRERNPDLMAKQAELDAVKREMKQMEDDGKAKIEEIRKKRAGNVDMRINGLKYNLQIINNEIDRQEKLLEQTNSQIADLENNINHVPGVEVGLEALNREYQTKKSFYDDLLKKKGTVDLSAGVTANAQGETIQVIDPANLPQQPVAPKRLLLMGLGLALGLGIGLVFAAGFEVPRLLTIQTRGDAEHYTGLPVLVSVPELLTPQEARWVPRRRMLLLAAGIVATIVSIPALALALKMTRIFEHFIS